MSDSAKAALAAVAVLMAAALFLIGPDDEEAGVLKIAVSDDAAGLIIARAAALSRGAVRVETGGDITFLKLADCCGSQAEFALAAGKFDLAVLCPDAAAEFLGAGKPFRLVGEVVRNANILAADRAGDIDSVGYMNGRTLQVEAISANLNPAPELRPMMTAALPYALERGAVDAVVLDILTVVRGEVDYQIRALPFAAPSSVLVAREDILAGPAFRSFLIAYNETVDQLNGEGLNPALAELISPEKVKDKAALWRNMGVSYIHIQAAN